MSTKELKILFEDNHILVCYKPAGIATQSKRIGSPDMVSILKNHIASCTDKKSLGKKESAPREPYLSVIHRLDQPVEGIMVFAKTPFAIGCRSALLALAFFLYLIVRNSFQIHSFIVTNL